MINISAGALLSWSVGSGYITGRGQREVTEGRAGTLATDIAEKS